MSKKFLTYLFIIITACFSLVSCADIKIVIEDLPETSISEGFDCITIAEAIQKAQEAGSSGTADKYYVYGKIVSIDNSSIFFILPVYSS